MTQVTVEGVVAVESAVVVKSRFVQLAEAAYAVGERTTKALNEIAQDWIPIIRERMESAGAQRSMPKEDPPTSAIVRRVTMEFYAEFFNASDKAMADLRAVAARKGLGIVKIDDADHMEFILSKCGAMSGWGGGLKYFDNLFRQTRNDLGFRELKQRKGKTPPTAAEAAENASAVAEAMQAVLPKDSPTVVDDGILFRIAKGEPMIDAIARLMQEVYGVDDVDLAANLEAALDHMAAAALAAKGEPAVA